jgi:hypothetical protein
MTKARHFSPHQKRLIVQLYAHGAGYVTHEQIKAWGNDRTTITCLYRRGIVNYSHAHRGFQLASDTVLMKQAWDLWFKSDVPMHEGREAFHS